MSKGKSDIVKIVQYKRIQNLNGQSVYNLGFGDYDINNDRMIDSVNSNNGDTYSVFTTVLGTIPNFFETYPAAMLMVRGSDSTPEFETQCRNTCDRKCTDVCKKKDRRISAYRKYVNRNFEELSQAYRFWGGISEGNQIFIEEY